MRQKHEVSKLTIAVADVVAQQALGLEAERGEHGHRALLLGHDLDVELGQAAVDRLQQRPAGERPPDAPAAPPRVDHQADLAHMVRPAAERHHRDVADDLAVVAGERPPAAAGAPRLDRGAVEHRLLEEGALGRGNPLEEREQAVDVVVAGSPEFHHTASLWSAIQFAMPGSVTFAAARPATSPTCPAASRSSSVWGSRRASGSAAASGTMWSRSATTLSTGMTIAPTSFSISSLPRTSRSTVCRNAAPGKGTWSRVHWPITW